MSKEPVKEAPEEHKDEAAPGEASEGEASENEDEPTIDSPFEGDEDEDDADPPASGDRTAPRGNPLPRSILTLLGLGLPAALLVATMWRVRSFTIDDAYISYRYARNLARGLGLVYNPGERIEGYTNFLWTVLLAGAIRLGFDADVFAKVAGALCALGALGVTYALAARFKPFHTLPCMATWLLASTVVFSGYAVFGLETSLFTFLLLAGTWLFFRETDAEDRAPPVKPRKSDGEAEGGIRGLAQRVPFSGLVFALAGLTRPEAPMFIGILMLFLGRRMFSARNILRGALFALPVIAHLLWRKSYYGAWLPNTLSAKTGNINGQVVAGWGYVQNYVAHAGPVLYFALFGAALGYVLRRRDMVSIAAIGVAVMGYVTLVGGDWMPFFRFMAPFEPFVFLMVDVAMRDIADRRGRAASIALAAFMVITIAHRASALREAQQTFLKREETFWKTAAGGTARWLLEHGQPGEVAVGDIGYIGYATDYPILDTLGLVDPVISKLPGGYTRKIGPGFTDRVFGKAPTYILIISGNNGCDSPTVPGSQVLYRDRRLKEDYAVAGKVPVGNGILWCLYKRNAP